MADKDGGPAFPVPNLEHDADFNGMTLRDYLAGQVLIGLSIRREGATDAIDAQNAYALADAMLLERDK